MKVKDIMTKNPITISGKTPIFKIEQILRENKIWSLIIEDSGKFIGIVTKSDLKHRGKNRSPKTPAFAIMTRNMITIDPECDVEFALSLIFEKHINGLPVVKNGKPCGIITKYDIREKYLKNSKNDQENRGRRSDIIRRSFETSVNQKSPDVQTGFLTRFKNDINSVLFSYFVFPLKQSYYEDTIKFLALLATDIGIFGIGIVTVWFTIQIFLLPKNPVSSVNQFPIELFIILWGFFSILIVCGAMIMDGKRHQTQRKTPPPHNKEKPLTGDIFSHKFEIALSFSGKYRPLVEQIALSLNEELGDNSIFYDNFYRAHLAQPNLDLLLQKIYSENSRLNVVFLSSDYQDKEWCGIEYRAIREIIKTEQASRTGQSSRIMLLKLADVNIKGLFSIDGYLDIRNMSALEISNHILDRIGGVK